MTGLKVKWMLAVLLVAGFFSAAKAQTAQEQLAQIRSAVTDTVDGQIFFIHTIKRGQTLYMISKAYGVQVNDIIRENPGVKEGIKADQTIRIPSGQKQVKPAKKGGTAARDTVGKTLPVAKIPVKDTIVIPLLPCGIDSSTKKQVYSVALMLPLFLGDVDGIQINSPDQKSAENIRSFQFLPFYEGLLLALDSLGKAGIGIKLYVYDVDKDTARTRQVLRKPEMKSMDLIIGLLYHRNFQMVASFAKKNRITLINPISERSELVKDNPYVFKLQPARSNQPEVLAEYLAHHCSQGQILIIRNGQYPDKDIPDRLKAACLDRNLKVKIADGQQSALTMLSKEAENFIIAFSVKPEYTIEFTRRLYELRNEYPITLFALPDWSSVNGIEVDYLIALKAHMMGASFIDYDNPGVKRFVKSYQQEYSADPEFLAFQGYDAGMWFFTALQKYGTGFARCIADHRAGTIQAKYLFQSEKDGGFENRYWTIFRFMNYRLVSSNL